MQQHTQVTLVDPNTYITKQNNMNNHNVIYESNNNMIVLFASHPVKNSTVIYIKIMVNTSQA